jgi:hypothetical protein
MYDAGVHKSLAPGGHGNQLCTVASDLWVLGVELHVIFLGPRILSWLVDFWKIYAPPGKMQHCGAFVK